MEKKRYKEDVRLLLLVALFCSVLLCLLLILGGCGKDQATNSEEAQAILDYCKEAMSEQESVHLSGKIMDKLEELELVEERDVYCIAPDKIHIVYTKLNPVWDEDVVEEWIENKDVVKLLHNGELKKETAEVPCIGVMEETKPMLILSNLEILDEDTVNGRQCYVIRGSLTPAPEDDKYEMVFYIDKDDYLMRRRITTKTRIVENDGQPGEMGTILDYHFDEYGREFTFEPPI